MRLGDAEAGRRRSDGSSATRVDTSDEDDEQALGLEGDDDDPNIVTWYGPGESSTNHDGDLQCDLLIRHNTYCSSPQTTPRTL